MVSLRRYFGAGGRTLPDEILDEKCFSRFLQVERSRSDRSGRRFLLLLGEIGKPVGRHNASSERRFLQSVIDCLADCTRRTDLTGWYRQGSAIGVIFTEVSEDETVPELIVSKVRRALHAHLKPEQVVRIQLSTLSYPNASGGAPGTELDSKLYPEAERPSSAFLFKRFLDVVGSLGLLIILSPLLVVTCIAVKSTSRGPVFFRQVRIGRFGRPFTFLKFRSMYTDTDCRLHEEYVRRFITSGRQGEAVADSLLHDGLYKIKRDPRVTPLGRILRKTSIDELPQLFNVLRGDMSLVGPRPPVPYEFECYDTWHKRRVREARPGITGLWQVEGRSRTTFNEMVRFDLKYLNEWSLRGDIKILLQTPWAVLTAKGAC